jgi:pyruvate/2-oxoacid:ferredoxin oxidoreductase beta subunit
MEIMAAHRIPYATTCSIAFLDDLKKKVAEAQKIKGFRFIHILSPCPVGWKYEPGLTIEIARRAVMSNIFPLYEIENGERYTVNFKPIAWQKIPAAYYLKPQKRFAHLKDEDIAYIQRFVDKEWERLLLKERFLK